MKARARESMWNRSTWKEPESIQDNRQHQEDQIQIPRTYKYLFSFKEIHIRTFFSIFSVSFWLPFVMQSFLSLHCCYCSHFCCVSCCFFCVTAELSYCFNAIFIVPLMKMSSFVRLFVFPLLSAPLACTLTCSLAGSLASAFFVPRCQPNLPLKMRQYNCEHNALYSLWNKFVFVHVVHAAQLHSYTSRTHDKHIK